MYFIQEFIPNALSIIASIYILFSISNLSKSSSFWGYIFSAFAVWVQWVLCMLTYLFVFTFSPFSFFKKYAIQMTFSTLTSILTIYCSWVLFSYARHIYEENYSIVESGRDKLVHDTKEHDTAFNINPPTMPTIGSIVPEEENKADNV
jgi:hypothetical protein